MFWNRKEKYKAPQITEANFNDLIPKSDVPVLLDFYADWCGPCKIMGPIIDELSEEYQGKALIAKIDTEQNQGLSQHFKIKSIPTLIMIDQGQLVERWNGLIPKPNLEEILDAYIKDSLARKENAPYTGEEE